MVDQAEVLRSLVRDRSIGTGKPDGVFVVAVTSGKGGVGKTSLAVNLALLLVKAGRRVRLVDADFGLANAEVLLGTTARHTLEDILKGRIEPADAWHECPGGVMLLSSGSGLEEIANMDETMSKSLISRVLHTASAGDIVIIDTSPGIDRSTSSVLTLADEVMVVTTPEPTSITDCYAAIKVLISHSSSVDITLVANACSSPAQASAIANSLEAICKRFLPRGFSRYEYLPEDPAVGWAIRNQKPMALASTHAMISTWLRKTALKLDERVRSRVAEQLCPLVSASALSETISRELGTPIAIRR